MHRLPRRLGGWVSRGAILALFVLALAASSCAGSAERPTATEEPTTATVGPTLTATPKASSATPSIARNLPLRAFPDPAAREVAGTLAGTPVRLAGRLEDSSWYYVEV